MYLAHHYIERRSVVFIIDSTFASYAMLQSAFTFMKDCFDEMGPNDNFGYICIDQKAKNIREI